MASRPQPRALKEALEKVNPGKPIPLTPGKPNRLTPLKNSLLREEELEDEETLPIKGVRNSQEEALANRMQEFADAIPRGGNKVADILGELKRHISKTLDMSKELGHKSSDLAPIYRRVRDACDAFADPLKELISLVELINSVIIPEAFERDKLSTLTTDEGDRVTVAHRIFASILVANQKEAYAWLKKNKHGDIIKETVNAGTLSSLAKELAEENKQLPEKWFSTHEKAQTSLTRAKAKKSKQPEPKARAKK